MIPPGLLTAPGIQKKLNGTTTTSILATTTPSTAATTSSETIPATPATPATPAQPISVTGVSTVPATPATPATPAVPATTTTPTATTTPTTTDTTPPSALTNLTVIVVSSTQINLSWSASTDNVGVVGYKMYRNGNLTVTTGTSYSDTGLAAGTTYSYTVAAYDFAGNVSAQSGPISATTQSIVGSPLLSISPTSLTFTTTVGSNPNQQTVAMTNSSSQNIYWARSSSATWLSTYGSAGVMIPTTPDNPFHSLSVTIDVTGLAAGTYTGILTFSPQNPNYGPSFSSQLVNVTLTVNAATTSTATSISSLDLRAKNLAIISQMVSSLDEILKELSQLLR